MNISRRTPVASVGSKPPVLRRMGEDGEIIEEKIPAIPYHRKFVTPSGNVVRVPLATGRTIADDHNNGYGIQKLAEKLKQGFLLYAECPYATGALPVPKSVTPCQGTNPEKPGTFWSRHPRNRSHYLENECCQHVEDIIARRQGKHTERQAEMAERFKTSADRVMEAHARAIDAQAAQLTDQQARQKAKTRASLAE